MPYITFSKEKLSLQQIGLVRFWVGVLAGLLMAMSLSLFFAYLGEGLRFLTLFQLRPEIRPVQNFASSFLLCALSTALGFSATMQIWLSSKITILWRVKQLRQAAVLNIHFLFWAVLWLGSKIGAIIYLVPQKLGSHLRLSTSFESVLIFTFLPVFIFLYNWQIIHRLYRAYGWMLASLLICLAVSLLLSLLLPVKYEIINNYLLEMSTH